MISQCTITTSFPQRSRTLILASDRDLRFFLGLAAEAEAAPFAAGPKKSPGDEAVDEAEEAEDDTSMAGMQAPAPTASVSSLSMCICV